MEKKKYSAKKFVAVVSAISVVGLATFFGVKAVRESEKEPVTPPPASSSTVPGDSSSAPESSMPELIQLEAPKISFNEKTDTLYWEEVPNSEYYIASINGKEQVVEGTLLELDLEPQSEYSFKVKAVGNGTNYLDSTWSNTISHLKQDPEVVAYNEVVENLRNFISGIYKDTNDSDISRLDIERVYYKDNQLTFEYTIEHCPKKTAGGVPIENPEYHTEVKFVRYDMDIEQKDANTMEELAQVTSQISLDNAGVTTTIYLDMNYFTGDLTPFFNDEKLGGELREYLDKGYEVQPLHAHIFHAGISGNIGLKLFLRLKLGDDLHYIFKNYRVTFEFMSSGSEGYWSDYVAGKNQPLSITELETYELDSDKLEMFEKAKQKAEAVISQTQSLSQAPEAITSKSLLDIDNINFAPNK